MSIGTPTWRLLGDVIRFEWAPEQIEAEMEASHRERYGLYGELTILSKRAGQAGLLFSGRFNSSNIDDRAKAARYLGQKIPSSEVDWASALEQICLVAKDVHRRGDPMIDLREIEPQNSPRWLLEPFVATSGISVIFADGGSGKSTLALACGLSIASGRPIIGTVRSERMPVLYFDYEDDQYVHAERLRALCKGADITEHAPIYYRRMTASLEEVVALQRREIAEKRIGCVILDSLGMARGGEPESADVTLRTGLALRALGVPSLVIDHIPKLGAGQNPKPFGSVFTHNMARVAWFVESIQQDEAVDLIVRLTSTKRNRFAPLGRRAYRVTFFMADDEESIEAIGIKALNAGVVPELLERMSLPERILLELKRGARLAKDLAEEIGEPFPQVKARLWELEKAGRLVRLADKRYGLRSS